MENKRHFLGSLAIALLFLVAPVVAQESTRRTLNTRMFTIDDDFSTCDLITKSQE